MLTNRRTMETVMEDFETVTLRLTFQYVHRDQIEDSEFEMVEDEN